MTTGALVLRSGYTTQARRLSLSPLRMMTHSPCRGEALRRASASEASGGSRESLGALTTAAGEGAAWSVCESTAGTILLVVHAVPVSERISPSLIAAV